MVDIVAIILLSVFATILMVFLAYSCKKICEKEVEKRRTASLERKVGILMADYD